MKRITLIAIIVFVGQIVYSQQPDHRTESDFRKTIEYNIILLGDPGYDTIYNLQSKSDLDRIFFGETNSPIEFIYHPSGEMRQEVAGMRIVKDGIDSYKLEVFQLPNADEILHLLSNNTREIALPYELKARKLLSLEGEDSIREYNDRIRRDKFSGEIYEPYRVVPKSIQISSHFADQLHSAMRTLIDNFKANNTQVSLMSDGYSVKFRCVVDNELWTLSITQPQQNAKQLSDALHQLMTDVSDSKEIDESRYLEMIRR